MKGPCGCAGLGKEIKPLLPEEQEEQAYTVSAMLYPILNTLMMPLAALLYETLGMGASAAYPSHTVGASRSRRNPHSGAGEPPGLGTAAVLKKLAAGYLGVCYTLPERGILIGLPFLPFSRRSTQPTFLQNKRQQHFLKEEKTIIPHTELLHAARWFFLFLCRRSNVS